MMETNYNQIVSLFWTIADDVLRDVFLRGQYRDVILPMVVLRRLDALLEPTKKEVEEELKEQKELGLEDIDEEALMDITGLKYFNTSRWTLNRLKSQASDNNDLLYDNFVEYLNGYSENVRDVLKNFEYYNKAQKLANNDRLLSMIERITDPRINLTDKEQSDPDGLPLPALTNHGMGTVFEELLRRFNEENNEEAGEHFTPRDAIRLLARLVFDPVMNDLPKVITMRDPAEGSGGMLTEGREYLIDNGVRPNAILLSGMEINPETYAISKSDLIIKGVDPSGIRLGNTITDDYFQGQTFGFQLTNPPYGKSWKTDKEKIYHEKQLLDRRYELSLTNFAGESEVLDCIPRTSDGQLLFMLEMVDKMKPLDQQPQGSDGVRRTCAQGGMEREMGHQVAGHIFYTVTATEIHAHQRACYFAVLVAESGAPKPMLAVDNWADVTVKFLHHVKNSTERGNFLRFYDYLCHVIDDFCLS